MQRIEATELRPGDRIKDLGVVTLVVREEEDVIFYVHEEIGGFMVPPTSEIEIQRDEP